MVHSASTGLHSWAAGSGILIAKKGDRRKLAFPDLRSKKDAEATHGQSLISYLHTLMTGRLFLRGQLMERNKRFEESHGIPEKEGSIFTRGKMGSPKQGQMRTSPGLRVPGQSYAVHMKQFLIGKNCQWGDD